MTIESVEKALNIGHMMSNVCYNLSQKSIGAELSERDIQTMRSLAKEWPEAISRLRKDQEALVAFNEPKVEQLDFIAHVATSIKHDEFKEMGWEINHKITSGDVRCVLRALKEIIEGKS